EYLVFALIWQIIKQGILGKVKIEKHPELQKLTNDKDIPPEDILLKWLNYHLKSCDNQIQVNNLTFDLKDSKILITLLKQLDNSLIDYVIEDEDDLKRAEKMLEMADKIGCRSFVTATDVVEGNEKLMLMFIANIFNKMTSVPMSEIELKLQETTIKQLQGTVELKDIELLTLQDQINSSNSEINVLNAKVKNLQQENQLLQECIEDQRKTNKSLSERLFCKTAAMDSLQEKYENVCKEYDDFKTKQEDSQVE
ncbi:Calponin domain-containing and Fimbrin-like protein, partial [Rozella allomycis CSF55]